MSKKHLDELLEMADLFIELESSLEKYYELCAKIFPDEKFAWFGVATQEGIHAKIFKKIKEKISQAPEKWSLGKYNYEVLKTTVDSIHKKLEEIQARDYVSIYIVTFAKDIEFSLIESDISNAFVSSDPEYGDMIKKIIEETEEHKDYMTRFLASREIFKD
jgi:hypothetical protein